MMGASGEPSGYYPTDSNRVLVQSELPAPCACSAQPQVPMPCSALWDSSCGGSEPCAFPQRDRHLLAWGLQLCALQPPIPPIPIHPCQVSGGPENKDKCAAICLGSAYCIGTKDGVQCFCDDKGGACSATCARGGSCKAVCPPGSKPLCGCQNGFPGCGCIPPGPSDPTIAYL